MSNAHIERPARTVSRRISNSKRTYRSRDYFGEALRILDNDRTLEPQREHLAALWGLAIGLTRRLTQAYVASQDDRAATVSDNDRRLKREEAS